MNGLCTLSRPSARPVLCSTALLMVIPLIVARARHVRHELDRPFECCSAQHITTMAAALARHVLDEQGTFVVTVGHTNAGTTPALWYATVSNADGVERLQATWNAPGGDLLEVSTVDGSGRILYAVSNARAASEAAATWLMETGLGRREGLRDWEVVRVTNPRGRTWGCTFQTQDRHVCINVDAHGRCLLAVVCPRASLRQRNTPSARPIGALRRSGTRSAGYGRTAALGTVPAAAAGTLRALAA